MSNKFKIEIIEVPKTMSNNKQSSIDYLIDNLYLKDSLKWEEIIKQAKAMHRVEIIESYASGSNDRLRNTINTKYYNETFGSEQ